MSKTAAAHRATIVRGGAWAFGWRVAGLAVAYAFTVLIGRRGGAGALGVFSVGLTLVQVAVTISALGLDVAVVRFLGEAAVRGWNQLMVMRTALKTALLAAFGASLVVALVAAGLPAVSGRMAPEMLIAAIALPPATGSAIVAEAYRGIGGAGHYSFLRNAMAFTVGFVLFVSIRGRSGQEALAAWGVGCWVAFIIGMVGWQRDARVVSTGARGPSRGEMLQVSIPLLMASASWMIMSWTDILMLAWLRSNAEVGVYAAAAKIAPVVTMPLIALSALAAPRIAALAAAGERAGLRDLLDHMGRVAFYLTTPLVAGLVLGAGLIMRMFGPGFAAGTVVLYLVLTGQTINAFCGPVGYLLQMTGGERVFRNIVGGAAVLNIVLNAMLIPYWGPAGAACASMLAIGGWNATAAWFVWRRQGIVSLCIPMPRNMRSRA